MEKKTIGAFIAALRKANGLTQRQLAEKLNVSDKAVSRWERDEAMPDLSLIPVIAEIFDVTSDEILRGQRKTAEDPETKYETQKTEKQIQRILKETITTFKVQSTVSVSIAIIGFITAMICNMFTRANLGFGVSCIFYVAALMCQVIFTFIGLNALSGDDLSSEQTASARTTIIKTSMHVISFVIVVFCATLPLITLILDAYQGLGGGSWFWSGCAYALAGLVLCLFLGYIVDVRLGYRQLPDLKKPRNKLRVRSALVLILVLLVTFICHFFVHNLLYSNMHLLSEGTRWDSWEELKEFLETPTTRDGEEMTLVSTYFNGVTTEYDYIGPDGTHYITYASPSVLVYEADMETPKYEYIRHNLSIVRFKYSATEDHLPIYTYSDVQLIAAENRLVNINIAICSLYLTEIAAAILIYRSKAKKLANAA